MSPLPPSRLAWLLLRSYPAAWRRRYSAELADLIAAERLTARVAADVVMAGLRQRVHAARLAAHGGSVMTIGPAWRHPTAFAVGGALLLLPTLVFVGASLLGHELGVAAVRGLIDPVSMTVQRVRIIDLVLVAGPPLAFLVAVAPLVRLGVAERDGALEAAVAIRPRVVNVVIGLVALALSGVLVWHVMVESVLQVGA